jgi:hypothetical protein
MPAIRKYPELQYRHAPGAYGISRQPRETIKRAKSYLVQQAAMARETGYMGQPDTIADVERLPDGRYYYRVPSHRKGHRRSRPRESAIATIRLQRRRGGPCLRVRQLEWLPGEGSDGLEDESECL